MDASTIQFDYSTRIPYLGFMVIDAKYFAEIKGTVFVVVNTSNWKCDGVFKTQSAANKLRDRIRLSGSAAEVRVGHFEGPNKIVTL